MACSVLKTSLRLELMEGAAAMAEKNITTSSELELVVYFVFMRDGKFLFI